MRYSVKQGKTRVNASKQDQKQNLPPYFLGLVGFLTVASGSHVANAVRLKVKFIMKSTNMTYLSPD